MFWSLPMLLEVDFINTAESESRIDLLSKQCIPPEFNARSLLGEAVLTER